MLSPDAADTLDELDFANTVYVIGGLVDRTVIKSQSLQKAVERGVSAARLPLPPLIKGTVLNINTVVEILHHRYLGSDWSSSFRKVIPPRKFKTTGAVETDAGHVEQYV
jgi:tRNA (guanine9-N1)-methyltransferase